MVKAHHVPTAHDGPGFRLYRWTLGPDETGEAVITDVAGVTTGPGK